MSSIIVEKKEDIPSSNDASYAKDHDPKDLFVRIKPEYLHPKPLIKSKPLTFENSSESSAQQNDDVGNKRKAIETVKMDSTVHVSLKKRHNESRPAKENRLCSSISKGEVCAYGDTCQYNHDFKDFLSRKPADIGTDCYQFITFGHCLNGLMCRYGSNHINVETGENLIRTEGVIERPAAINLLSKDLQLLLRKKKYSEHIKAIYDSKTADTAHTAQKLELEINHATFVGHEPRTVKLVDFSNKVYVAPLTTVGNLPFRRILKDYGADITCGEMALGVNLEQGQASEWALLRRHTSEDVFGVQIAGYSPDQMNRIAKLLEHETCTDFVDLNCGCPIDLLCERGCGSALMTKPNKLRDIISNMTRHLTRPMTVKMRTGWDEKNPNAHKIIPDIQKISRGKVAAIMIHGRSRLQRYHKLANWEYIFQAANSQNRDLPLIPIIGNGDIMSNADWQKHMSLIEDKSENDAETIRLCSCAMLGRGALIKPWLPKELKDQKDYDISASERLDMLKTFCNYGLEHWGSDSQGVATTRRFLLEWMSFLYRYVPFGITETHQTMNQRPPHYFGRCDLETLMASNQSVDWIRISEMLLGPVPDGFSFAPKHKSNSFVPDSEQLMNG